MAEQLVPDEKITEYPNIAEGFYTAAFSDMRKNEKTEGGVILEFLLLRKSIDGTDKYIDLVKITNGSPNEIELKKLNNGQYFTLGLLQRLYFNPIVETQADYIKSFLARQRKLAAVAFNAYDHDNRVIKWGLIEKSLGNVFTFNLRKSKKDTRYVNIDVEGMFMLPTQKVSMKSIEVAYAIIDEQRTKSQQANPKPDIDEPPF